MQRWGKESFKKKVTPLFSPSLLIAECFVFSNVLPAAFLWASSWLHVKVRLLIKSFALICIMRHWKICLNLRDPVGPLLPLRLHRFILAAQFKFPGFCVLCVSCVWRLTVLRQWWSRNATRFVCAAAQDTEGGAQLCLPSIGRNLLLVLFCFARHWFALISPIWIEIAAPLIQLWRASSAFSLLLHTQGCVVRLSNDLNRGFEKKTHCI